MKKRSKPASKQAKEGEKMIEIKVRFWTNDIADESGHVLPKHAWASGVVRIEPNALHGIKPGKPRPFHSLMDLSAMIEKVLIQHEIVLHAGRQSTATVRQTVGACASALARSLELPNCCHHAE